jgi:hypothetical protein
LNADFQTSRAKWKAAQRKANGVLQERKASQATIAKQEREKAAREIEAARSTLLCTHGVLTRTKDPIRLLAELETNKAAALAEASQ